MLGLRPMFHRFVQRVRAHACLRMLAYYVAVCLATLLTGVAWGLATRGD